MLVDELMGNLDYKMVLFIYDLMCELNCEFGIVFLVVIYDGELVVKMDCYMYMKDGLLIDIMGV